MKKDTKNTVGRTAKAIADATANLEGAKNKYRNAIEACEKTISSSEDKMINASVIDDTKAYLAAKRDKEEAEGEREMYQRRLAQIERDGLVSDAEAKQIVEDLRAAEEDEFQSLTKEVKELAVRIAELHHSYEEAKKELNDLNSLLPEIKPNMQSNPLAVRMGNAVFSFAAYAERFAESI